MAPMRTDALLDQWLERVFRLVNQTQTLEEYRVEILRALREEVDGSSAAFFPGPPVTRADGRMLRAVRPVYLDHDPRPFGKFVADHAHFRVEMAAIGDANMKALPYVDSDIYPGEEIKRTRFWTEILEPAGNGTFMAVPHVFEGEHFGVVVIFRKLDRPRFAHREAERLNPIMPLLVMGDRLKAHTVRRLIPAAGVRAPIGALTGREREVAQLAASGMQNKAIAQSLGLSPNTVRNTLSQVFDKLEVTTRTQLAAVLFETV